MKKNSKVKLTPREWAKRLGDDYHFWRSATHRAGRLPDERITKSVFLAMFQPPPSKPEPEPEPESKNKPAKASKTPQKALKGTKEEN